MSANDNPDTETTLKIRRLLLDFWNKEIRGIAYNPDDPASVEAASVGALSAVGEIAGLDVMERYLDGDYGVFIENGDVGSG